MKLASHQKGSWVGNLLFKIFQELKVSFGQQAIVVKNQRAVLLYSPETFSKACFCLYSREVQWNFSNQEPFKGAYFYLKSDF